MELNPSYALVKNAMEDSSKRDIKGRFVKGHGVGKENVNWRNYTITHTLGYILKYYPDHPFADCNGYVMHHRLIYELYNKCCLLKWTLIHHKNKIRNDNRIENLEPMFYDRHTSHHMMGNKYGSFLKRDMSKRLCVICGKRSYIDKDGGERWYRTEDPDKFMCQSCGEKQKRKKRLVLAE